MAAAAVLTASIDPTVNGVLMTFIVPSFGGCGLKCPMCFIAQRQECVEGSILSPTDYATFIHGAASAHTIAAVTIQGHECLSPLSLPWTEAILSAGLDVGAETGLVTNGLFLAKSIETLKRLGCGGVTVSIDADNPAQHDKLRGRLGAWQIAMEGLALASAELPDAIVLANSVLFSGHTDRLSALPQILADIGIRRWSVSPLLNFRRDGVAVVHGKPSEIQRDIGYLSERAMAAGIEFCAEDEFRLLLGIFDDESLIDDEGFLPEVTVRTLSRPDGLLRLTPDGKCAFGLDVLRSDHQLELIWAPNTDVPEFLNERLQGRRVQRAA